MSKKFLNLVLAIVFALSSTNVIKSEETNKTDYSQFEASLEKKFQKIENLRQQFMEKVRIAFQTKIIENALDLDFIANSPEVKKEMQNLTKSEACLNMLQNPDQALEFFQRLRNSIKNLNETLTPETKTVINRLLKKNLPKEANFIPALAKKIALNLEKEISNKEISSKEKRKSLFRRLFFNEEKTSALDLINNIKNSLNEEDKKNIVQLINTLCKEEIDQLATIMEVPNTEVAATILSKALEAEIHF